MKTILLTFFVIFPVTIFGAEDIKIPFITNVNTISETISESPQRYNKSAQDYAKSPNLNTKSIVKEIGSKEIAKTIHDVKTTVCGAVENGSIKVYFTLDVAGKLLGIGASSGAGIEVTFNCEKGKSH